MVHEPSRLKFSSCIHIHVRLLGRLYFEASGAQKYFTGALRVLIVPPSDFLAGIIDGLNQLPESSGSLYCNTETAHFSVIDVVTVPGD